MLASAVAFSQPSLISKVAEFSCLPWSLLAKRIEFVCAAEMGGKLTQEKANERIKTERKYLCL
mgnify:CR=1 FL=1